MEHHQNNYHGFPFTCCVCSNARTLFSLYFLKCCDKLFEERRFVFPKLDDVFSRTLYFTGVLCVWLRHEVTGLIGKLIRTVLLAEGPRNES